MDTSAPRPEATADLLRGGFWRRWAATLIDSIIVMLPFQILAAILFSLTAGMVQMKSGVLFTVCAPVNTIPQSLNPPPPRDSNFARVCKVSFFGAPTGAVLTVGRATRDGHTTTTVTQGYMLDNEGKPVRGTSIDGIAVLALLVYLVGMVWKTGRTLGARILGLRVVDVANPGASEVPIHKAIIRYLAMAIGFVPMFAVLIYHYVIGGGNADAMFTGDFFRWFSYAGLLGGVWGVVLIFQIASKKDPIYDRLAGTAVVRDRDVRDEASSGTLA
jgi:uncharacterized RDD family membrane protein YckC